jgi:hypothetical protein
VFQSIRIPLRAFVAQYNTLDIAKLKAVRLEFDRTRSGAVIVSEVGFSGSLQ